VGGKNLPEDIVSLWPEVFGDVVLNSVPYPYLESIIITFENGKIWNVEAPEEKNQDSWDQIESNLKILMRDYGDQINNIDFKLDTAKIKKDVIRQTKKFLKQQKL